jgi:glutathione S-transferase
MAKMRLYSSPNSPFARKVRVAAIETGIIDRLDVVDADPRQPDSPVTAYNPLRRIPTLVLENGDSLFESVLVCEYLDSLHDGPKLFPATGPARWRVLRLHALGDGAMSYAVFRINETRRPEGERSPTMMARWQRDIGASLDMIEKRIAELDGPVTIGVIAVGCVLAYLDFRFAKDEWRKGRPVLARWYESWAKRPSMTATMPPGP